MRFYYQHRPRYPDNDKVSVSPPFPPLVLWCLCRFCPQSQEEANILRVCQNKVRHRNLPMKIVDAEYQFDMNKLTLFFEAER